MENITPNLFDKITNLSNLFNFQPSTDFSYAPYIFALLVLMFIGTYAYEFFISKLENKYLKKSLKNRTANLRWTFPLIGLVLLLSRLEGVSLLNMKIWWVVWLVSLVAYKIYLLNKIKKDYSSRLKNKERFSK